MKMYLIACVNKKDSDQPVHMQSVPYSHLQPMTRKELRNLKGNKNSVKGYVAPACAFTLGTP